MSIRRGTNDPDRRFVPAAHGNWLGQELENLFTFLRRRMRCEETARDLVQETCLRLVTAPAVQSAEHRQALAYRIAANLAIDHDRKLQVRFRALVTLETQCVHPETPGPERELAASEALVRIGKALDDLSPPCRKAFELHALDELTYAEIADRLGISTRMVGKHIARALRHCRDCLGPDA
jgi:RNA polymerase sigma-70 factor (ECF subfamily)